MCPGTSITLKFKPIIFTESPSVTSILISLWQLGGPITSDIEYFGIKLPQRFYRLVNSKFSWKKPTFTHCQVLEDRRQRPGDLEKRTLSDVENFDILLGNPRSTENRIDLDLASERSFGHTGETNSQENEISLRVKYNCRNSKFTLQVASVTLLSWTCTCESWLVFDIVM